MTARALYYSDPAAIALFWGLWSIWIAGEVFVLARAFARRDARTRDRGSFFVFFGALFVGFTLGSALVASVPAAAIQQGRSAVFVVSLVLMASGIALRFAAVIILGRFFTPIVKVGDDQHVVEAGPYRWVRHPSYTGGLLIITGALLASTNWLALIGLLPVLAGLLYRMRVEEQALIEQFGDTYRSYMGRTKRLVPYLY